MVIPLLLRAGVSALPVIAKVAKPLGSAVKTVGKKALTSFSQASFKTQVAVTGGSLISVGVLKESPKARQTLASAPSSLVNVGSNVGKLIENPSKENLVNIYQENPVASSVLGGAIALGASGAVIAGFSAYQRYKTQEAIQELPNILQNKLPPLPPQPKNNVKTDSLPPPSSYIPPELPKGKEDLPVSTPNGITDPVTVTGGPKVPVTTSRKRKRFSLKKREPILALKQKIINISVARAYNRG